MKNKVKRLLEIKKIIGQEKISSQDELLEKLAERGLNYTQATLSRDLKFLKVGKIVDDQKGSVYVLPESHRYGEAAPVSKELPVNGYQSLEFSNNMAVIKTLPGYANGIAYAIDNLKAYEILGTIAGDDTILIIPREEVPRSDLRNILSLIIPEISKTEDEE
jgi:transcriptional regulator of arginine metabolism